MDAPDLAIRRTTNGAVTDYSHRAAPFLLNSATGAD
jgi:hypothetical protein